MLCLPFPFNFNVEYNGKKVTEFMYMIHNLVKITFIGSHTKFYWSVVHCFEDIKSFVKPGSMHIPYLHATVIEIHKKVT